MSKYYYIKSQLNGLVLDVEDGVKLPSSLVNPWGKTDTDGQKFYDDPTTGTIRCKLNDLCMDIECGQLVLNPYQSCKQTQQWERRGKMIASRIYSNLVLDIYQASTKPRTKIIVHPSHDGRNQSWIFEPI